MFVKSIRYAGKEKHEVFNIEKWYAEWSSRRDEAARKASLLQIAKDEAEYQHSMPRFGPGLEDAFDDGFCSDEERLEAIEYENVQIAKDEAEHQQSKLRFDSGLEDVCDDGFCSDEERLEAIEYENLHLAFDPEKSPKCIC